jgi:hypothetical protein
MDNLGPLHYCDPDVYPVGSGDEQQKAIDIFPTIEADVLTFSAIIERSGMTGQTSFSDADKLQIYREWKTLQAVNVQPLGGGLYSFDVTTEGDAASGEATHYTGTVDATIGSISIADQEQVFGVACPI